MNWRAARRQRQASFDAKQDRVAAYGKAGRVLSDPHAAKQGVNPVAECLSQCPPSPPCGGWVVLPPLLLRVPAAFGEQAVQVRQRAVAVDEESKVFTVGLARPLARPRLAARIIRIETVAAKRLPAAMRTAFHVAAVLVLLADRHAAIGTVFHRGRSCHLSPRPKSAN